MHGAKRLVVGAAGAMALIASMGAQGGCGSTGTTHASTGSNNASTDNSSTTTDTSGGNDNSNTPPQASWYSVRPKIMSKECFGSAGCNVTVKLVLTLVDPTAQGRSTEISVRVTGDESGPSVETIDVDSDGNYTPPELMLSTASNATPIRARITEVVDN
jgi:hypothetical protein